SVEIFFDDTLGGGFFFCNTSMIAFGEFMQSPNRETLSEFLDYFIEHFHDPRGNEKLDKQNEMYKHWLKSAYPELYVYYYN
ncbi:unnamed protein product, partial [marine sediment metagenome]